MLSKCFFEISGWVVRQMISVRLHVQRIKASSMICVLSNFWRMIFCCTLFQAQVPRCSWGVW